MTLLDTCFGAFLDFFDGLPIAGETLLTLTDRERQKVLELAGAGVGNGIRQYSGLYPLGTGLPDCGRNAVLDARGRDG